MWNAATSTWNQILLLRICPLTAPYYPFRFQFQLPACTASSLTFHRQNVFCNSITEGYSTWTWQANSYVFHWVKSLYVKWIFYTELHLKWSSTVCWLPSLFLVSNLEEMVGLFQLNCNYALVIWEWMIGDIICMLIVVYFYCIFASCYCCTVSDVSKWSLELKLQLCSIFLHGLLTSSLRPLHTLSPAIRSICHLGYFWALFFLFRSQGLQDVDLHSFLQILWGYIWITSELSSSFLFHRDFKM